LKKPSADIQKWFQDAQDFLQNFETLPETAKTRLLQLARQILAMAEPQANRLYLIVNEGVHPIVDDLKKQFGQNILCEVITSGNVTLQEEKNVAAKVKEIVEQNRDKQIVIVPSGLPYLITVVYNTVFQITSRHPLYLQLDRERSLYVEKNLDPRKLIL